MIACYTKDGTYHYADSGSWKILVYGDYRVLAFKHLET
jgi:hypothetical protein